MKIPLQCSSRDCHNEVPTKKEDLNKTLAQLRAEVRYCEECRAYALQQKLPGM